MAVVTEAEPRQNLSRSKRFSLGYEYLKGAAEVLLCLVVLVALLPLLAILALAIKLTSRGPIFAAQTRLGRHGQPFQVYKLRCLRHAGERQSAVGCSTPGDTGVTWLGGFLRAAHLDELPQLWNVLRRQMSLVGPRPERPEIVERLEEEIPQCRARLAVRPGVTGLAQVHLPPDSDVASVRRKVAFDLYYIRKQGPWMDLRILACTALKVAWIPFQLLDCALLPAVSLQDLEPDCSPPRSAGRGSGLPDGFSFPAVLAPSEAAMSRDIPPAPLSTAVRHPG